MLNILLETFSYCRYIENLTCFFELLDSVDVTNTPSPDIAMCLQDLAEIAILNKLWL